MSNEDKYPLPNSALKCMVTVSAGVVLEEVVVSRSWNFTQEDLDKPPIKLMPNSFAPAQTYIDQVGAAMNYAMSLQNPKQYNWVTFEWTWF